MRRLSLLLPPKLVLLAGLGLLAGLVLMIPWTVTSVAAETAPGREDLAARQAELQDTSHAPGPVQRTLFAAAAQLQRGEADAARAELRRHLARHPDQDHHLIRHQLALLLAQGDSLEAALVQLQAAVDLEPDLQPAWRNLGEVSYGQGDVQRAATAFGRAVALDPDDDPALRYYEAAALLQADQPAPALARLESLLDAHDPPSLDWHRLLLASALAADKADEIVGRMDALTTRWPDDPEAWLLAARHAQAINDYHRAVRCLTLAHYLQPLGRGDLMLLGDLCRAVDAPARAAVHYRSALDGEDAPRTADLDRLVAAQLAAFATEGALTTLDRRLALEPAAAAWRLKGEILYAQERYAEALAALDEAAALDPSDARVDLLRGYCGLELDRPRQAREHLRAALRDEKTAARARAALDHLQRTSTAP